MVLFQTRLCLQGESSQIIKEKKKKQEREQSTSSWHMNKIAYTCISGEKKNTFFIIVFLSLFHKLISL